VIVYDLIKDTALTPSVIIDIILLVLLVVHM